MCSPRVGEIRVQPKPAQQVQIKGAVAKWSGECLYVKRFETGMQYTGSSYREYDIKTLQEDVGLTRKPSERR